MRACYDCRTPVEGRSRCETCAPRHAQRVKEHQRLKRMWREVNGLCRLCDEPRAAGFKSCQRHLEMRRAIRVRWTDANGERLVEARKAHYDINKAALNHQRVLSRYGITPDDYVRMHDEQGGLCRICKCPETATGNGGAVKRLSIDHCHETGRVRGLLCNNCNRAIGLLGDSIEVLESAITYIAGVKAVN